MTKIDVEKALRAANQKAIDGTGFTLADLEGPLEAYMFEGEGEDMYSPFSETRVKKPAHKLRIWLESLGFNLWDCSLNQCEYNIMITGCYSDNSSDSYAFRFTIDYWNREIY